MTEEPLVYIRGRLVPASEARVSIYDFGIVLGYQNNKPSEPPAPMLQVRRVRSPRRNLFT